MLGVLARAAILNYALHRALLAMERRGWISYRTKGTGSMGDSDRPFDGGVARESPD